MVVMGVVRGRQGLLDPLPLSGSTGSTGTLHSDAAYPAHRTTVDSRQSTSTANLTEALATRRHRQQDQHQQRQEQKQKQKNFSRCHQHRLHSHCPSHWHVYHAWYF